MHNLVCLDRDGTVNKDDNYYLGSSPDWKRQVRILDGVFEGIKRLNAVPDLSVFVVTNQSGVALRGHEFDELTEERMQEVNEYILGLFERQGARVEGYTSCPYVTLKYAKKARDLGREVDEDYIVEHHDDIKPNRGMVMAAANSIGIEELGECNVYVIGDRKSDVQLGLNSGGKGILVASAKTRELGDVGAVRVMARDRPRRVYIAQDFLDAVGFVVRDIGQVV